MNSQWLPRSPCGPECLRHDVSRVGTTRVAARLGGEVLLLLGGFAFAWALVLLPPKARGTVKRAWFRALLRALGLRLVVRGQPVSDGLFVSNHVSWLDCLVLQAARPMRLLAKSELKGWPLVGVLASRLGTLYIERDRLSALPGTVRAVADALRSGATVGAFPEGTTWCGFASGTYRPAVFQAAIDAGARVHPVALRFRGADGTRSTSASFVGNAKLIDSVVSVARARGVVIELTVLPELDAARIRDRRELARQAQAATLEVTSAGGPALPHALAG